DGVPLDLEAAAIVARVQPLTAAVGELPRLIAPSPIADRLQCGQMISFSDLIAAQRKSAQTADFAVSVESGSWKIAVFAERGSLIAIARLDFDEETLSPEKVFSL